MEYRKYKISDPWDSENSEFNGAEYAKLKPLSSTTCDPKKIQEIIDKYHKMISHAKSVGWDVAASNMQDFLNGKIKKKTLSVSWLRGFDSIKRAESRILHNTEKSSLLADWIPLVKKGTSINKTGYWDADIRHYYYTSELTYASGASDMRGDVSMNLSRKEDIVSISGTVKILWTDDYNWNKGMGFYIPGTGYVKDEDGLYLEKCAGAKSFSMESSWQFDYKGEYDVSENLRLRRWLRNEWKLDGKLYIPIPKIFTQKDRSRN